MPAADARRAPPPSSWLYVPGDRPDRFAKAIAASSGVILDLEDAVAATRKDAARGNVRIFLDQAPRPTSRLAVRINRVSSVDGLKDLIEILRADTLPDALLIPKVEDPATLHMLDEILSAANASAELFALIESPRGVGRAGDIAIATPRLTTLMFGAADYAAALGREAADLDLAFPASMIVNAAACAGLTAIDTPCFILNDTDALESACRAARRLAFHGKAAIHPAQVEVIQRIFAPTPAELDRARKIVALAGNGAAAVGDEMVDVAMLRWAKRLVP